MATAVLLASSLIAWPSRANTNGIHLHQFGLRCRTGLRTIAYLELQSDSLGTTLDPAVGWTLYSSSGAKLFDTNKMFLSQSGSGWSKGQDWLVAGTAFHSLTGVAPDGPLPVLPDTLSGSIVIFRLEADGVTRTQLDRVDYGPAFGLPVPLGAAMTRQPDLSWAVDWNPKPRNLFSNLADVSRCFSDSIPTPKFHLHQFALRCRTGSQTLAYFELQSDSLGATLDPAVGWTLYSSNGTKLFDTNKMFLSHSGSGWSKGLDWLVAGAAFQSFTGVAPDGPLPVLPDTLGGSIVIFRLEADGVTRMQFDRVDYGPAFGLPVPLGAAMTRQPDLSWAVDWDPKPRDLLTDVVDVSSCFGDSTPMPQFHRFATRCADGSSDGAFLELTPLLKSLSFDPGLQLSLLDHNGHSLATLTTPFGARTGQPWAKNRSFLMAAPGFIARSGIAPDALLPVAPDPLGGSLIFSSSGGPLLVTQTLAYGASGTEPAPGAGRDIVWQSGSKYGVMPLLSIANFAGDTLGAQSCFGSLPPSSCPQCTPPVPGPICPPLYAPYNESGDQDWLALTSDSRVFTEYSQEPVRPTFQFTTDFDLSRGYLHSHSITYLYEFSPRPAPKDSAASPASARPASALDAPPERLGAILAQDEFMIVGPEAGMPVDFLAGSILISHLSSETAQRAYAQTAAPFIDSLEIATIPVVVSDTTLTQMVALPLHAIVGTPFTVSYGFHAAAGTFVDSRDSLYFSGIPAGYGIVSCHGLSQPGTSVVATLVEDARADASPGHASMRWVVLQPPGMQMTVQRRADDGAWLAAATLSPDDDGAIVYDDVAVLADHRYGYRLAWTDPRRGALTGGEVWVSIPSAFRFALREVSPNPARGVVVTSFQLGEATGVQVELLDIAGRRVLLRDLGTLPAGDHALTLTREEALSPGVYMVRLRAGTHVAQTRVILLR